MGWEHPWCGDRKLSLARAAGCDEGESLCQSLWETVLPLSHCSALPFHVSASSTHSLSGMGNAPRVWGYFRSGDVCIQSKLASYGWLVSRKRVVFPGIR